jgi:hypothetical protein
MTGRAFRYKVWTVLHEANSMVPPLLPFDEIRLPLQDAWQTAAKRYKLVARAVPKRRDTHK